jgi:hypothetical protein
MAEMCSLKNMLNDRLIIVKQKLKLAFGLMSKFILESNNCTHD